MVYARSLGPLIARPILWLVWIFTPFIWLNRFVTQLITRHADETQDISAEEIETIARMSRQAGGIAPHQERVISNILNLQNLRARDIMTPRTVVFSLDSSLRLAEVRQEAGRWRHSRVPLYGDHKDQIVGLVWRRLCRPGRRQRRRQTGYSSPPYPHHSRVGQTRPVAAGIPAAPRTPLHRH